MGKKCTSKEEVDENEHKTRGRLNRKTKKKAVRGPLPLVEKGKKKIDFDM